MLGRKLRVRVSRGGAVLAAVGMTALVSACGSASSSPVSDAALTRPTVAPAAVPVLGSLTLGSFPSTQDGTQALLVCEQWAGLRAAYVARLRAQTPYQLEQWFSSHAWLTALNASRPLRTDPDYSEISIAFGLVSTPAGATIANARLLDQACATGD